MFCLYLFISVPTGSNRFRNPSKVDDVCSCGVDNLEICFRGGRD